LSPAFQDRQNRGEENWHRSSSLVVHYVIWTEFSLCN